MYKFYFRITKSLLFGLLFISLESLSLTPSQDTASGLSAAYGFLFAQKETLDEIERKFPELKDEVLMARMKFDASYSDALGKTEKKFIDLFPGNKSDIEKVMEDLRSFVIKRSKEQNLSKEASIEFLIKTGERSKGNIESENAKRYIHSVIFDGNPELELLKHSVVYDTTGNPKAKGLDVLVKMPFSWNSSDSNFPNTLRTWVYAGGQAEGWNTLEIRKFDGDVVSKEDVQRAVKAGKIPRGIIPKEAVRSNLKYTEISRLPAVTYDFESSIERLGNNIMVSSKNLVAYDRDKIVILSCGVGGKQEEVAKIRKNMERVAALCMGFFNSLIVKNAF